MLVSLHSWIATSAKVWLIFFSQKRKKEISFRKMEENLTATPWQERTCRSAKWSDIVIMRSALHVDVVQIFLSILRGQCQRWQGHQFAAGLHRFFSSLLLHLFILMKGRKIDVPNSWNWRGNIEKNYCYLIRSDLDFCYTNLRTERLYWSVFMPLDFLSS